jgi:hypothetical protein
MCIIKLVGLLYEPLVQEPYFGIPLASQRNSPRLYYFFMASQMISRVVGSTSAISSITLRVT